MSDPRPGRHRRAKMTRKPVRVIMAPVSGSMGSGANLPFPAAAWGRRWAAPAVPTSPSPDKSAPE